MNAFKLFYEKNLLIVDFEGDMFDFDLTTGDTGEFWSAFVTPDGRQFDINFWQEDEESPIRVTAYPVQNRQTDLNDPHEFVSAGIQGNPKIYFES